MTRKTVITACAVAVCVSVGGAVGYATTAGGTEKARTERAQLPVQAFLLSYQQRDDLNRAYERLVERCMRERGAPVAALTHVRPPLKDFLGRRYGLTDLEQAEQYGYGLPPSRHAAPPTMPKMTTAQRRVYDGGSGKGRPQGCVGWAVRQLGDDSRARDTPFAMQLQRRTWDASAKDPRVVAAVAKWSSCMSARGYPGRTSPVDTPGKALASKVAERAQATAEVRCNRSSGVVRQWFAVEAAYQEAAIERDKDRLVAERYAALRVVDRARAALGD